MGTFDVVIVGNGVLGLSLAYSLILEDPNLKVAVVGPTSRSGGASLAAGAMLGCFGEVTHSTFHSEYGLTKFEIALKAAKMWPEWLDNINQHLDKNSILRIEPSTFIIHNTNSGQLDDNNYLAIIKALNEYNEPYEEINPRDIPGLKPIDDCRPLRALFLPNESSISPTQLIDAFHILASKTNRLSIIDDVVTEVKVLTRRVASVETINNGIIHANKVVIAAGAYSQVLIDKIDEIKERIPKVLSGIGYGFIFSCPDDIGIKGVIRTPNRAGACGLHAVSRGNSSMYLGASNYIDFFPKTNPKLRYMYYLLQYGIEQINQNLHDAELLSLRVGNRPVTIDTFPLIGETAVSGLWLLTGTYRDGLHDSPLLAQSMAKEILGKKPLFCHKFHPERFPIQTLTREQAISEATNHFVSTVYEHSAKLPRMGWDTMFKQMIHERLERIYEKLDINIGLPPDLLIMINRGGDECISYFREYYRTLVSTSEHCF